MRLCSRCTGILLGSIIFPLLPVRSTWQIAIVLVAAFLADALTQLVGLRTSNNWLRFSTGVGFSVAIISLVGGAVSYWTFSETVVDWAAPPLVAVTVTMYPPDGVPRYIWLLPPRSLAQEVRAKPMKTSTPIPSNASKKTQVITIPALAAK